MQAQKMRRDSHDDDNMGMSQKILSAGSFYTSRGLMGSLAITIDEDSAAKCKKVVSYHAHIRI
jgi:hypothetical protein